MSGINPGSNTGNILDAGASSATKNTDLSEGIFEDVSNDIKRKQQGPILGGGAKGGLLDGITGSTGSLGHDAQHQSGLSKAKGSTDTNKGTEFSEGVYEDASKQTHSATDTISQKFQNLKDSAKQSTNSATNTVGINAERGKDNTTPTGGGLLDTVRDKINGVFHGQSDVAARQESALAAGASSAIKSTDLSDGIHEDAGRGIESINSVTTRRN